MEQMALGDVTMHNVESEIGAAKSGVKALTAEQQSDKHSVNAFVENAILSANELGLRGTAAEEQVVNVVTDFLEQFDHQIPIIGAILDWGFIDAIQKEGVRTIVRLAYGLLNGLGLLNK